MSKPEYRGTKETLETVEGIPDPENKNCGRHKINHIDVWFGDVQKCKDPKTAFEDVKTIIKGIELAQKYGSLEELERQRNEAMEILKEIHSGEVIDHMRIDHLLKSGE